MVPELRATPGTTPVSQADELQPGFRLSPGLLAVVVACLAVVGLLITTNAWVRRQVLLSTTRVDQPLIETYFAEPKAAATCPVAGVAHVVTVVVGNRSAVADELAWQAKLTRLNGPSTVLGHGTEQLAGHEQRRLTLRFTAPSGQYTLDFHDASREHVLYLTCRPKAQS